MDINQEVRSIVRDLKAFKADDLRLLEIVNAAIEADRADGRESTLGATALAVVTRITTMSQQIQELSNA